MPCSKAAQTWCDGIRGAFDLEAHHELILDAAATAWDRMTDAREHIERDGAYVEGRYGLRAHPAVAVERDSRIAFLRSLRELGLDALEPEGSRPPKLRY